METLLHSYINAVLSAYELGEQLREKYKIVPPKAIHKTSEGFGLTIGLVDSYHHTEQ
jgi:hypothetical protein